MYIIIQAHDFGNFFIIYGNCCFLVENSGNVFDTFCVTDVDMTDNALCKMILNESLQMNIHNTISQRLNLFSMKLNWHCLIILDKNLTANGYRNSINTHIK